MTSATDATTHGTDAREAAKALWSLGDYHTFATATVWGLGPELVAACGIAEGDRVLDVAAGSGNVALRAAEAGARSVALDVAPASFDAGRREAAARGVEVEWVEGDAMDLPFDDASFDVVTSAFGVMFAADHRTAASELLRVCRPGGTIGLMSFTPEGLGAEFFATFVPYAPPPAPGALPPVLWGSEEHLRELFGAGVAALDTERRTYVERAVSPAAYRELFRTTFGPVVGIYASLEGDDRRAALDRAVLAYAERANGGRAGGPAEYRYEYLLAIARTAAG